MRDRRAQKVVQLVGVARIGLGLGHHRADRVPVDDAEVARRCASCFTARERRSSSGASSRNVYGIEFKIACAHGDGATVSRATHLTSPAATRSSSARSPSASIDLLQAVARRLGHERMVGQRHVLAHGAAVVVLAARRLGKHGGHEVGRAHAQERRRRCACRW